jgi:hypothetical protein
MKKNKKIEYWMSKLGKSIRKKEEEEVRGE